MALARQFLVSPALARLIRKERGTQVRVREGYFSSTAERTHFVRLEPSHCSLIMVMPDQGGEFMEEATEVPLSQAQALLDVAPGQIAYERTALVLAPGLEGMLERILVQRPLHLLTVSFEEQSSLEQFQPPLWAGAEVSGDPAFSKAAIALQGEAEIGELEISDASLEALLDLLQGRFSARQSASYETWSPSTTRRDPGSDPFDDHLIAGLASALDTPSHSGGADTQQRVNRSYPTGHGRQHRGG